MSTLKIDGITLLGTTAYPANPTNGDMVYRSDFGKVMVYQNFVWNEFSGNGSGTGGNESIKSFLFNGSVYQMANFAQTYVVTADCMLTKIALTALISGIAGTTVVQVNIGNGPSGSITTTASLPANGGVNSSITLESITLHAGDMIWLDVIGTASDQLENLNAEITLYYMPTSLPTGYQGALGVTGLQGATGLSSYGVTGLQGVTGSQGDTGIQGITGLQGNTGLTGDIGLIGSTGLQGIQGVTGLGITGLQGSTGLSGYGVTGLQGSQGNTGLQGNTGVQGITGLVGVTGLQGITGLRGQTGLQGNTGVGTQGNTGVGTQGTTGLQGVTGLSNSPINNTLPALVIDWSLGDVLYKSVSSSSTFTFSNNTNGKTIIVIITNTSASAVTITLPTVKKRSDFSSTIAATSSIVFTFVMSNGSVYAASVTDLT